MSRSTHHELHTHLGDSRGRPSGLSLQRPDQHPVTVGVPVLIEVIGRGQLDSLPRCECRHRLGPGMQSCIRDQSLGEDWWREGAFFARRDGSEARENEWLRLRRRVFLHTIMLN